MADKMPTQSKKTLAITPTDRPAKPKKKKKKESGRTSRNSNTKTPAWGADSSSEGTRRTKSRAKSRAVETVDVEKNPAGDSSSKSRSSSTQNTSSSSWRTCSSDGRSTSSSGENFSASSCTNSASSDESRARGSVNDLGHPSSTSLTQINETLRWDYTQCDDPEEEEERLRIYKLHRRKRYMDFLHKRTGGEPHNSFYA